MIALREWTWTPARHHCSHVVDGGCDLSNGSWRSPSLHASLCWTHYAKALREEAASEPAVVLEERARVAAALEAWAALWAKPSRVAFTDKTVASSGQVSLHWLKEFAGKIRDGTFGKPHGTEPDPLYETEEPTKAPDKPPSGISLFRNYDKFTRTPCPNCGIGLGCEQCQGRGWVK